MYLCMISMQILTQIAWAPEGTAAAAAPTLSCVYFGISFMPGFLDWKMNMVPNDLGGYYYDEAAAVVEEEEKEEMTLEMEQIPSDENV